MEFFQNVVVQVISAVIAALITNEITAKGLKVSGLIQRIKSHNLSPFYFVTLFIFSCLFYWLISLFFEVKQTKQALLNEIKQESISLHTTIEAIHVRTSDTKDEIEKINNTAYKNELKQLLESYNFLYVAYNKNEYSNDEALIAKTEYQSKADSIKNLLR